MINPNTITLFDSIIQASAIAADCNADTQYTGGNCEYRVVRTKAGKYLVEAVIADDDKVVILL
jgi:hypothetical protein